MKSFTERRKIRESSEGGQSIDAADKCVCDKCGQVHYVKREGGELSLPTPTAESSGQRLLLEVLG